MLIVANDSQTDPTILTVDETSLIINYSLNEDDGVDFTSGEKISMREIIEFYLNNKKKGGE